MTDYNHRKNDFRSIKVKARTMAKLDWIKNQMLDMGFHFSKSEMLHVITLEYARRLEQIKVQDHGNK
ncbi:hypothetical protein [Pontibacter vulgaris]|uniref:hypothetical protein n=1 Tax=Pontibacter vulgaris TaxID=2905679 RepID=UPI001FA7751B|nr:hypothetical protein [Pontibacter vulgaris]